MYRHGCRRVASSKRLRSIRQLEGHLRQDMVFSEEIDIESGRCDNEIMLAGFRIALHRRTASRRSSLNLVLPRRLNA